jgi:excisionase family DNA binding protein
MFNYEMYQLVKKMIEDISLEQKKNEIQNEERLLTISDASQFLNVKESWLRSAIFKKEIPYIKCGNLIRFNKSDLRTFIKVQKSSR